MGELPEGYFDGLWERLHDGGEIKPGELAPIIITPTGRPSSKLDPMRHLAGLDLGGKGSTVVVICSMETNFADIEMRVLAMMGEEEGRAFLEKNSKLMDRVEGESASATFRRSLDAMTIKFEDELAIRCPEIPVKLDLTELRRDPKRPAWAERNQAPTSPKRSKRR